VPIPSSAIRFDAHKGSGRFQLHNFAVPDYGNFYNAMAKHPNPAPKPSRVSFDVSWHGGGAQEEIRNATFGFMGTFVDGPATISFSAKNDDSNVVFRSLVSGQKALYAGAGTERNGIFFV
jgi:hypothetical protein